MRLLLFVKALKNMTWASVFNSIIADTSGRHNAMLRLADSLANLVLVSGVHFLLAIVGCYLAHIISAALDSMNICTSRSDPVSYFLSWTIADA